MKLQSGKYLSTYDPLTKEKSNRIKQLNHCTQKVNDTKILDACRLKRSTFFFSFEGVDGGWAGGGFVSCFLSTETHDINKTRTRLRGIHESVINIGGSIGRSASASSLSSTTLFRRSRSSNCDDSSSNVADTKLFLLGAG